MSLFSSEGGEEEHLKLNVFKEAVAEHTEASRPVQKLPEYQAGRQWRPVFEDISSTELGIEPTTSTPP